MRACTRSPHVSFRLSVTSRTRSLARSKDAKVEVDVSSDWNTAVHTELLRVAYSAGTNPLWVRAHAAACGLEMTRA